MREWLIQAALKGSKLTYIEVRNKFNVDHFSLLHAMNHLGHQARQNNEPILTAVIVSKKSGCCGRGLKNEFQVINDESERLKLYRYWNAKRTEAVAENLMQKALDFTFKVGSSYHREDVFRIIGPHAKPTGRNGFTYYTANEDDWFVFCGVGTGGRSGHGYRNHFDGDKLVWFAKSNSNIHKVSIRKLCNPEGRVYVFFREEDRAPFTFAGIVKAVEVFDQSPVKIIWSFRAGNDWRLPTQIPEEIDESEATTLPEGARRTVLVNLYERNPNARRKCIANWGLKCTVCSFDFRERYGELGEGFIHVHHLKPLGEIGEQYELNPIADLRPVCPNCHAMLHRRIPSLSLDELIQTIKCQQGRLD